MIDFSTLQSVTIPEGVVTQIADASGRVLWAVKNDVPIVLEVEQITSNTYVSSTAYTNEQFLMLNIYPKTASSTVNVTYGGLTKTLTFSGTNAKQVYFGTYGGVADGTPTSGTLTIEGECSAFGIGTFESAKSTSKRCSCITAVTDFGSVKQIPNEAFYYCRKITNLNLPSSIGFIANNAFAGCGGIYFTVDSNNPTYSSENGALFAFDKTILMLHQTASGHYIVPNTVTAIDNSAFSECGLTGITLPNGLTTIGNGAFSGCSNLVLTELPNGLTTIGNSAFLYCGNVSIADFPNGLTSIGTNAFYMNVTERDTDGYPMGVDTKMPKSVTLPATLKTLGDNVFDYLWRSSAGDKTYIGFLTILATTPPTISTPFADKISIIVPKGCGEAYKTAEGWSDYADTITEVE